MADALFYFDISCPYALIASTRVEDVAKFTQATIEWRPVLLGGLYQLTSAAQGAAGSASDAMPPARRAWAAHDLERELSRYQLDVRWPAKHPMKTVDAMRLLCAVPSAHRIGLAKALYRAYWMDMQDVTSHSVLLRIARRTGLSREVLGFPLDESIFATTQWADDLRSNTQEAFEHGAFGVPTFWLQKEEKMLFGQDRLCLLEAHLSARQRNGDLESVKHINRLMPRCLRTAPENRQRTLKFWFDFSSPWSFLGYTQLQRVKRELGDSLKIEMKPFLLGALFKAVGTPVVPSQVAMPHKAAYMRQDLQDWAEYWSACSAQTYPPLPPVKLAWPDEFPIRSVIALRVALLEPAVIDCIYRAGWSHNRNISTAAGLLEVLNDAGFPGQILLDAVTTGDRAESLKAALRTNTDEAVALGFCGAPTFQIDEHLVWGQDRINVVQDLLSGWSPEKSRLKATVGAFPHFDYRL
ncbi:hypothetical protein E5Q_03668 [Mixia osmundae IAM 14324]|uniref:DSBA-like thioredoxin domain-containing protein n=1 Tax=Mixia osmundae (strain CBS 9802 / IAM 14324 / JCM 22182 / KY 12970) TaxID=764103 RepID=G7E2D3_MIXOS|nr:hypothetical protein E5Q_03668 [Mixia osmundae IAM 14324]